MSETTRTSRTAHWKPGWVYCDGIADPAKPDELALFWADEIAPWGWNGWAIPKFNSRVLAHILFYLASDYTIERDGDTFTLTHREADDVVEYAIPGDDGLFGVGEGWVWSAVDATDDVPNMGYRHDG